MKNYICEQGFEVDMRENDNWEGFLETIQRQFDETVKEYGNRLFKTNVNEKVSLWDAFLLNMPEEARQTYTCRACKRFVEKYGDLVVVKEDGSLESAVWAVDVPEFFEESVKEMKAIVESANVHGVFFTDTKVLGQPLTGDWSHMNLVLPKEMVNTSRLQTSSQLEAEKAEEFKMLIEAIQAYSLEVVEQAVILLNADVLYRSEKCLGVAEWLRDLFVSIKDVKNRTYRTNIIWRAVGNAPVGFCHVRSGMIGTLLDDIASGMDMESVQRRFADKMHPLKYQRPQAAPTAGNIMQAEKIVEKLGIEKALHRRFARLDEIPTIWKPVEAAEPKKEGVFGHLLPKENKFKSMELPEVKMTWEKFFNKVLPTAENIEYLVTSHRENYVAILTALYDDAPPILQWDNEEERNPFSNYVYNGGSLYSQWGLHTGYCKVTGICYKPSMWAEKTDRFGKGVYFILEGAKDSAKGGSGNALFPEILKSELHEVRSTIEAYSKNERLHGYEEASACGIALGTNGDYDIKLRVTSKSGVANYKIDRWD